MDHDQLRHGSKSQEDPAVPQFGQKAWNLSVPLSPTTRHERASPSILMSARLREGQIGPVPGAAAFLAVQALGQWF